jgi:hypothetical protein
LIKLLRVTASAGILTLLGTAAASAAHRHPLPTNYVRLDAVGHYGRLMRPPTFAERNAAKVVWTQVTAKAPFGGNGAGTAVLMTDGTVLIHDNSQNWYKLTPDITGSYINGTWSQVASLPSGYAPLYYADAVLPDGRLIIEGGEYNFGQDAWTNLGAIYDPVANTWTSVTAPSGWSNVGDAPSAVLPDGTFMLGNCCSSQSALLNPANLSWTATGTNKEDSNNEEGWSLLPSGGVLTVDVEPPVSPSLNSEIYNPATGAWASAGSTVVNLVNEGSYEIGPQVLMPSGVLWATGATGATSLYNTVTGTWSQGPTFPKSGFAQLDIADGPGSLLPNGDVLVVTSPGVYQSNSQFFEFTGTKLKPVAGTPNARQDSSYDYRMLPLPNGQVLVTDGSDDVEIYTNGGKGKAAWEPKITSVATSLTPGSTYSLSGTYLNGFSQAGAYGDDAQAATNYPLVRITLDNGNVYYARTHDSTSMAVASSEVTSTSFDVPATIGTGAAKLEVVANGIASKPIKVTIQ